MIIITYFILVLFLTVIASNKGNGIIVFASSLFLSPLFGLIVLFLADDKTRIKCPECDELISKDANVCMHCGNNLRESS